MEILTANCYNEMLSQGNTVIWQADPTWLALAHGHINFHYPVMLQQSQGSILLV